jgi:galactosylceramidase
VSYVTTLRGALDDAGFTGTRIVASDRFWDPAAKDFMGSPAMRAATAALTQHYPNCDASGHGSQCSAAFPDAVAAHAEYGVPLFSTEDYSCWTDDNSAVHWASKLNNNYLGGNVTFFSAWYLLTSFYPTVAFWNDGLLRATGPWGGHYELSPTLWATAHYTQFTQPAGWRYLLQGRGSGTLAGGGTYVSLADAVGNFTMVIEAAGAEGSLSAWSSDNCNAADGLHFEPAPAPQNATFSLRGAAVPQVLALWRSRFQRGARTAPAVFERLPDVAVGAGGAVSLVVEPDTVYTLSTFPGATKGHPPPSGVPPAVPFPLPYSDDFEALPPGRPGRYWSDMHGGFQVAPAVAGGGQVLRQAVPSPACCNFIQSLGGPLGVSILGDASWRDVEVAVDVRAPSGFALVGVRAQFVRGFFQGGLATPGGAFLAVSPTSWCWVLDVAALCGARQGAGCAAWAPAACALQGALPPPAPGKNYTRVAVGARNEWAWATIDGAPLPGLANFSLPRGAAAFAGAGFVALGATFSDAAVDFDNLSVVATAPPAPAPGVGSVLRGMPCGDAAADVGARWALSPGGAGVNSSLALAGAPGLCLAPAAAAGGAPALAPCDPAAPDQLWAAADASVVHAASGLCLGAGIGYPGAMTPATLVPCGRARRLYWSPDTGYVHTAAQAPLDMVCLGAWVPPPPPPPPPPPQAAAFAAAGTGVTVPAGGANASWDSGACNHVALLSAPSNPTFWLHVVAGAGYVAKLTTPAHQKPRPPKKQPPTHTLHPLNPTNTGSWTSASVRRILT